MSSPVICPTCGGSYAPIQSDGTPYVHGCGPIHRARVTRSGKSIDVDLGQVQPTDTRTADLYVERTGPAAGAVTVAPLP